MTRLGGVRRRVAVLAVAALLFAGVLLAIIENVREEGLGLPLAVAIALLAVEFGVPGGTLGALLAWSLFGFDALYNPDEPRPITLGIRLGAFVALGAVVGVLSSYGRREAAAREKAEAQLDAEAERRELETRLAARIATAEEEARRRIAEDLHDEALQSLLAVHQELIEASPGREGVQRAREVVGATIERLRGAVRALHPATLQAGDLESATRAIAREAEARGGFRCVVRVDADAIGHHDALAVSIARELIENATRHSGAGIVSVSISRESAAIAVEVTDDGRGIPPGRREAAVREGHIGLASIAQRLEAIGGTIELSSRNGAGTRARAVLPVPGSIDRMSRIHPKDGPIGG